jgi:hypothetical protein
MSETLLGIVLLLLAAGLLAVLRRRDSPLVSRIVWAGFVAHAVGAFAQVAVTRHYYGGGDMVGYYEVGRALAQLTARAPETYVPELIRFFLRQSVSLPLAQNWEGTTTGSMAAFSTLVVLVSGESMTSACLLVAIGAFAAKVALYDVVRERLGQGYAVSTGVALLLVPSTVFWSSGLLKESVAVAGMSAGLAAMYRLWQGRAGALLPAAIGWGLVALLKPYLLFPSAVAMTVWLYWTRAAVRRGQGPIRLRPHVVLLGLGSSIIVVVGLGRAFPEFAMDRLAEAAAVYQDGEYGTEGGSTISIGDPSQTSLAGQFAFVPLALVNVLFRPFAFEVRNAMMAVNAAETTVLSAYLAWLLLRRRARSTVDRILASPELVFSLVLVLTMAVGVGLTTTNLGTLSRYRMPLMPFYVLLVATLLRADAARLDSRGPALGPVRAGRRVTTRGAEG